MCIPLSLIVVVVVVVAFVIRGLLMCCVCSRICLGVIWALGEVVFTVLCTIGLDRGGALSWQRSGDIAGRNVLCISLARQRRLYIYYV
jgi:hypothetical protein